MMKRILLLLLVVGLLPLLAQASNRAAAFNHQAKVTISKNGVDAVYQTAEREKGLALILDQTVGKGWDGNLDLVGQYRLPAGARFENSGLDRNRMPFRHQSTARGNEIVFILRSRVTSETIRIKDDCLNPVQTGNRGVPLMRQDVETTWNFQEVDVQLTIDFHPELSATATATTAPITITFNNVTQAAPLMNANPGPQFCMVRDSRGLMSFGYTIGGGTTKIFNNVSATGGQGGAGGSVGNINNVNNNANSNSNVNGNTNVINTGSGSAAGSTSGAGTSNSSAGGKPPG